MKTLIIARHGNTFRKGEPPTRVGARTDLPLVEEERARCIGKYLKRENLTPDRVYAAPLKRTTQTAKLALNEAGWSLPVLPEEGLREIDYGPDENKTEDAVIARLGKASLEKQNAPAALMTPENIAAEGEKIIALWNEKGILPDGWNADVDAIKAFWKTFADGIGDGETVLVVSSNGTIRFSPVLTDDYDSFCQTHDIKTPTGGICVFENRGDGWKCREWNVKPFKMFV